MLIYLLKFSACLAIFMVFYKLFLERENMHHFKRYYLLGALVVSIGIPFVTFIQYVEPTIAESFVQTTENYISYIEVEDVPTPINYTPLILWNLYGLGVLVFGIKFILNLLQIFKKIQRNPKFKNQRFINVLLTDLVEPHTFFSYIFLNKHKYEAQEIPHEVFIHEQTHATQKHSIDVLFIELLQVVFWFNPLLYFIKKDIKLNHEFLADQAVLKNGIQPSVYQTLLLTFSSNVAEQKLANAINYSSIKKRFTVMKTHTSKQKIWLRSFLLLPLVALTLYGFSNREILEKEQISNEEKTNQESQQKATPEEVAEYNKLAKHYNSQTDDNRVIKLKDMKRLKELYDKMTKEQRANVEPFPNFPPPPPPASTKESPQVVQMHDLPPPPPIPANATAEQKKKYQKAIDNYNSQKEGYTYEHKTKEGKIVDVVVIPEAGEMVPPPPPPPPTVPSILEVTKSMAKNGAKFLYNNNEITSDEAITLVKKNPKINGNIPITGAGNTIVYLSDEPITVNPKDISLEHYSQSTTKNKSVELVEIDYPKPKSTLDYIISMAKKNVNFYYIGKEISSDDAISIAKKNPNVNLMRGKANSGVWYIYLSKEPFVVETIDTADQDVRINGIKGDDGVFTLDRKDLKNLKLTVAKGEVVSFKFKIPGHPTQSVEGNTFNQTSKDLIDAAKDKNSLQIILVKNDNNLVHAPLFINIKD